jgi:hypothetical protein
MSPVVCIYRRQAESELEISLSRHVAICYTNAMNILGEVKAR